MFDWIEIGLLSTAGALMLLRALPRLRSYRPLFDAGAALSLISALYPWPSNRLGQFLFDTTGDGPRLPREFFGVVWWILGAWIAKSLLNLALERTLFPDNDQPHSRRLFADLASGLIYILAFIGIVGAVFKEPVSTLLATSGVLAIVLGLALQNTLADVFSGLAINIERPFYTGDRISLADHVSGEVMQVNWRATWLRTWTHDMVVIPNSMISKAIVTNHSRPKGPHLCILRLSVDLSIAPSRVIAALTATASRSGVAHAMPQAYARAFSDSLVDYELAFAIEDFALVPGAKSEMLERVAAEFRSRQIPIGAAATDIRIVRQGEPAVDPKAPPAASSVPPE